MIRTLLIANRGEIACRITRTAQRMGIETVAVYSAADAHALHVALADRAVAIGPASARESYLNVPAVIAAARTAGVDAIHPGYGFLAERPDFAAAAAAAGLIFVGPPAQAMRLMGSKAAAKTLMAAAGVPVLPGYNGEAQDAGHLAAEAARIGFPLVIKAVAGGGGRGMRVVTHPADFAAVLAAAQQEALAAFGDARVLIEHYLHRPRHIEVQIFADTHGSVVHLFERNCSAQRRHQKLIEEAPAALDPAQRSAMAAAAVTAARTSGYVGAGTVEFIVGGTGFFFLEMNTRLQVEHPVTEMITGLDLVEWQLRVAAGEPLPLVQEAIRCDGHAIEARLYAEDPTRDFAPSVGRITALHLPPVGNGVRVDAGIRAGDAVSVHYDALLAKLICRGTSREEAIARLRRALAVTDVAGVANNLDFLFRLLSHPDFGAGIDTDFIARHADELLQPATPPPEVLALATLGVLAEGAEAAARAAAASADPYSPWHRRDGWWLNWTPERVLDFVVAGTPCPVRVRPDGDGWSLVVGHLLMRGRVLGGGNGRLDAMLDSGQESIGFTRNGEVLTVRFRGGTWTLMLADAAAAAELTDEAGGRLVAPIPGQITAVHAKSGQAVARGDTLVVLEAMKTVFRLAAPSDAVVDEVACRPGDTVEEGELLIRFAEPKA